MMKENNEEGADGAGGAVGNELNVNIPTIDASEKTIPNDDETSPHLMFNPSMMITPTPLTITNSENGLTLRNVSYKKKDKKILSDINCTFPMGQLTMIIGGSGSGKSSLLDVISRRVNNSKECSGTIQFKGRNVTKRLFQKEGGYVFQNDILLPTDTIHEVLMEASLLKYKHVSGRGLIDIWKERNDRTFQVENEMGLYAHRSVKIGNEQKKGASGGQRRRVSIGLELINNPELLLLDEYSSGLDSFTSFEIGKKLRSLAHEQGKTIVASVHQPSSAIFALFDNVMVLARGRLVFYGPLSQIKDYFKKIGYPIPMDTNPADWLINVVSNPYLRQDLDGIGDSSMSLEKSIFEIEIATTNGGENNDGNNNNNNNTDTKNARKQATTEIDTMNKRVGWLADYFSLNNPINDGVAAAVDKTSEFTKETLGETTTIKNSSPSNSSLLITLEKQEEEEAKQPFTSWLLLEAIKIIVLVWRNLRTTFRDPMILFSELFQAVFLGIFAGLLYFRLPLDQQSINDRISALFFIVASTSFVPAASVVACFPQQRALFTREREGNLYGTFTYFTAYSLVHTPVETIFPFIMLICSYWLVGFQNDATHFFIFLGILIIVQWLSESIGLLIGAFFETVDVGNLVLSVLLTVWMCFGGFLIRNSQIGWWFYPFAYTSLFRYSIQAMAQNELDQLQFNCQATSKALQSVNITELCSFRNGSSITIGNQQEMVLLEPYTKQLCSEMNWNSTVTTLSSFGCLKDGKQAINYFFEESQIPLWANVVILLGMFVLLRISIYLALRFRRWGKK